MMKYWVMDLMDELDHSIYPVYKDRVFKSEEDARAFSRTISLAEGQDIDIYWVTELDLEDIWDCPIKIINEFVVPNI